MDVFRTFLCQVGLTFIVSIYQDSFVTSLRHEEFMWNTFLHLVIFLKESKFVFYRTFMPRKLSFCPSTHEWIKKMKNLYMME